MLALDGGGIKGAFTAALLHSLEESTGRPISESFDLIIGTSTGGILALGIGLGVELEQIVDLYRSRGRNIFPPSSRTMFVPHPRGLIRPKFRPDGLRSELEGVFGSRRFGESTNRLVITAFNADDGDVKLMKTAHHDRFRIDHEMSAIDVALATSAAPTYFPAHEVEDGLSLIDGGVWANCPALVGVIEAITVLGHAREDVDILSIGTTDEPFDIPQNLRAGGVLPWVLGGLPRWVRRHFEITSASAPALLMRASEVGAIAQAELLTRRERRWDGFLRLNPTTRPERFALDSPAQVDQLVALGRKTAEHHAEEVVRRFMAQPVSKFVPCHGKGAHSTSSDASAPLSDEVDRNHRTGSASV